MFEQYRELSVSAEQLLAYLQAKLTQFQQEAEKYGMEDRVVVSLFDEMIACKEMVEAVIGMPVNLQQDGKVTVGF